MTNSDRPHIAWETHAQWWQDGFTDGADPEYEEQILPLLDQHLRGARRVVDVGAGEGQLSRRAHAVPGVEHVIGLEPSVAQLVAASARGDGPVYVRGSAERIPLAANAVDAVIACLVFEHIAEFETAIGEVARVLEPGGRFLFFLNHPLLQCPGSGWIDDHILDEQYWRVGPYLVDDMRMEEIAPGVVLPFVHRPLHRYVNAMASHGLVIEHMDEPAPPAGFIARAPEYEEARTIPRLLLFVARRTLTNR